MTDGNDWNARVIAEFRATGGTVEIGGFGRRLVLVHHVGASSGTHRVSPLFALRNGADEWFVAASKGGAPNDPAWYRNLLAHPSTRIETPEAGTVDVEVTELEGEDRDRVWVQFTQASPGFAEYERTTDRTIPVLALRRR